MTLWGFVLKCWSTATLIFWTKHISLRHKHILCILFCLLCLIVFSDHHQRGKPTREDKSISSCAFICLLYRGLIQIDLPPDQINALLQLLSVNGVFLKTLFYLSTFPQYSYELITSNLSVSLFIFNILFACFKMWQYYRKTWARYCKQVPYNYCLEFITMPAIRCNPTVTMPLFYEHQQRVIRHYYRRAVKKIVPLDSICSSFIYFIS